MKEQRMTTRARAKRFAKRHHLDETLIPWLAAEFIKVHQADIKRFQEIVMEGYPDKPPDRQWMLNRLAEEG